MKLYNNKKRQKLQRILAFVMAIFLLVSVAASLIYYLVTPVLSLGNVFYGENPISGQDFNIPTGVSTMPIITSPTVPFLTDGDEKPVTVGLMLGSGVTVGFETKADYGFVISRINRSTDLSADFLWRLDETKVSCTVDHNLSKAVMTYSKTDSPGNTVVGGWHAEIDGNFDYSSMPLLIAMLKSYLAPNGLYPIPSYIDGEYRIRVGHYSGETEATSCALMLTSLFPDYSIYAVAPSVTGVSVVNPDTDEILFEYDDKDNTALGLEPNDSPLGEEAYLITPAKNEYDGVFMFRRYIDGAVDGVSLTNIVSLGDYVKGVLPYEIGNTWPIESQKALAVCIRAHLLYTNKHNTVMACSSPSCCQQYRGVKNVNDMVIEAVDSTAGQVIAYNGKGVCAYFSAVTGGCTVGNLEGFGGGQLPYLKAVDTPWEIYTNHSYGVWTVEVSPTALCEYLKQKSGFTHLRGEIISIETKNAVNSTYVGEITFTDSYGNTATKKNNVYSFLVSGVGIKSGNFVVGKGSVETKQTTFTSTSDGAITTITARGITDVNSPKSALILTSNGFTISDISKGYAMNASGKNQLGSVASHTENVTVYAKNPNNFIFYGKGWGHGVGASQVGMRDLANLGYAYDEILHKYFTDIDIIDWRQSK